MPGMLGPSLRSNILVLGVHRSQTYASCFKTTAVCSTTPTRLRSGAASRRSSKSRRAARVLREPYAGTGRHPKSGPLSIAGSRAPRDINNNRQRKATGQSAPPVILEPLPKGDVKFLKILSDLRYPAEWFPAARALQRTIHLHIGPTNSGKTYQALKRLEEAETGLYAGPLRLLAYEVYTRLNAKGKLCNLSTGDDRRIVGPDVPMTSCTVEMVPLEISFDVAVIDEIQLINSPERGWAWTRALLGLKAKEIHLCGETRSENLIRELAASMGDKLEVHHHERLSPLKVMDKSLRGKLSLLQKGDAIIFFSRKSIHAMKREFEKRTRKKCAVVYGALPPETRAEQARLFNDPDNDYDIVAASDAIGMGLNLSIKRIVFASTAKMSRGREAQLSIPDIRQIAGRAGRYRTANQALQEDEGGSPPPATTIGLVTTLADADLLVVQHALDTEPKPITTAGLFPPTSVVQRFKACLPPETPFSHVLLRLHGLSKLHPRFHLCLIHEQVAIATLIDGIEGLSVEDRLLFTAAPAKIRVEGMPEALIEFARCVAEHRSGNLLDIPHLPLEVLEGEPNQNKIYLERLETLHLILVLYIWLSYRFAGVFPSRPLAIHVKEMVEAKIEHVLAGVSFTLSPAQETKPSTQLLSGNERDSARSSFRISTHHASEKKKPSQALAPVPLRSSSGQLLPNTI